VKVVFAQKAWADYLFWFENNPDTLKKINALVKDACRTPHGGLGKPEALKGTLSGWWSRRITGEHRLVYRIEGRPGIDQRIEIAQCRKHY
jgi:toxin YoeB